MYSYEWDSSTGGFILLPTPLNFSKEPRPVYYKELDILGFDRYWDYDKNDMFPYMWAEANKYWYRGRLVAQTKGGSIYTAPELILIEDPEPAGYPLRFVDIPAMVEKNRPILEQLTQETIKKIYNTFTKYQNKVDVFYVAFSGGKDSVVALDLVQRALPHNEFKVLFGDTGMEFPDTYDVVNIIKEQCSSSHIEFLESRCEKSPIETWSIFGPPAQTMRWCCSVHKTAPQILKLREYTNNPKFRGMAFTGIRGDESVSRSEYDDVSLGEKVRGQYSCHPILEWNSAELFLYIYQENLVFNEAYKKGNSRAGCLVCPMAAYKNMFFKEISYSIKTDRSFSTTDFNEIILNTTSKNLNTQTKINEFMEIAGWKARRSGRELSIAKTHCIDKYEKDKLSIHLDCIKSDWKEWLKTIGNIKYIDDNTLEIDFKDKSYFAEYKELQDQLDISFLINSNKKVDIDFMSAVKIVFRKSAYCVFCKVCEANCPYGYIKMNNNHLKIDDNCIKCRKCHDIFYGCLLANSMRLPKGESKMGSINRYGNMGVEFDWLTQYFELKDEFWTSPHSLGSKKVVYLSSFLEDSGIAKKLKKGATPTFTRFGEIIDDIGIDSPLAWGLIAANWAYTNQFGWWVKNIEFNNIYSPDAIFAMIDDTISETVRDHIVSAFKNIFISIKPLGYDIGFGVCDYEEKRGGRTLKTVTRYSWSTPDERVILYSLYKFAEACGNYRQFTLTRLLDHTIESAGISPTQIFGLDRDTMEKILNGLSFNYPDLIEARFTLGLDSITLKSEMTAEEILNELF